MGIPAESAQKIRFGEFELNLRTQELRKNGRKLTLQEQPFQILAALLERPGQLVTRDELTKRLWPSDTFVDFEHSLNKAVNRLREALDDSAEHPRLVETLPRRGYRFIAPLESAEPPKLETPGGGSPAVDQSAAKAQRSRHSLFRPGIILGLACLLAAGLWIRHCDAKPPEADFERLSFGRGMVLSARFAPDGQSVIYGAAWDGKPSQLFWARAGSFEARPLGVEADILGISASGEMAVLLNQHFGEATRQGTLALMPLTGSAPRRLLDNVQDADWSPDGSKLVVVHYVGGDRCDLEFPPGKVLYETTGGAWLSHPRISPLGDQIAFLEHPLGDDDSGFLAIINLMGRKKILSQLFWSLSGVAWDPAGDSIWFSGYDAATSGVRALYKVSV